MAGNFRGHTFNALMQPRAVDDRPLTFRGAIAPLGTYANPDGTEEAGLAWPGMITEPLNALQRLHQNSFTEDGRPGIPNPQHPENLQDASTLLWSIYGGNALNPAAAIPKNAVGMSAGRIAKTADTGKPSLTGSAISSAGHDVSGGGAVTKPSGITAYHGSPHDFDKFDMSKIGTGEGAQAYGHGLYFAENEGVANSYRRKLSQGYSDGIGMAREALMLTGGDFEKAIAHVLRGKDSYGKRWGNDPNRLPFGKLYDDAVRELRLKPEGLAPSGHMYQVKINASPEDFLDWDLPLSQQSEKVKSLLNVPAPEKIAEAERLTKEIDKMNRIIDGKGFGTDPHPDDAMRIKDALVRQYLEIDPTESAWWKIDAKDSAARPEAAENLREAGIPGIRYLDQMSRTAGDGSRNYVVFDDSLIEILKKYGLAGGAIGAGSLFDFNTEQQY